jgi:hypothetical protein
MAADIIGLEFMDGSVWYCPRETLTSIPNSYLNARFHHDDDDGNIIPPGAERTDDYGRSVYFIARDGQLFGKHILPYLATNDANLSSFAENVKLWRQLQTKPPFTVSTHSRISCTLRIRSIPKRMEIEVYCIGLVPTRVQPSTETRTPEALSTSRVGST